MLIPTFRDIIARLTRQATVKSLRLDVPASGAALRFNVSVRPETRAFLAAQADALGSSLAAISGNILDSVAASEREAVGYSRELLTSRFYLLLKEHGLSLPAAAEVLRSRGITAGDMSDQKLLLEKLNVDTLKWLADHFHCRYEWLAGQNDWPLRPRNGSWYKMQMAAARRLAELAGTGARVELVIARLVGNVDYGDPASKDENAANEDSLHFIPFVRVRHQAGPNESYETFEVWEHGRWNYSRCREHIKMVIYFATEIGKYFTGQLWVSGISLPREEFKSLSNGSALVPGIVRKHSFLSWGPDDFVEPWSAVAKDKAEWASILGYSDYQPVFKEFEQFLAKLKS